MNSIERTLVASAFIIATFFPGVLHANQMYFIGTVASISDGRIVLDSRDYILSSKVKVILRVVGNNGAIHERDGRFSDIAAGNRITVKVSGGEVTEIEKIVSR